MDSCRHPLSEDNLAELADGRPRLWVRLRARLHLLRCRECRQRLSVYRRVVGEVRAAPPFHGVPPEDLAARALDRAWRMRGFLDAERTQAEQAGGLRAASAWIGRGWRAIVRSRGLRVVAAVVAVAGVVGIGGWLWWSQPRLVLESTEGQVLVDGRRIEPGRRLPAEAAVTCIGDATFAMRGVRLYVSRAWTQFDLTRAEGKPQFRPAPGAGVQFVDEEEFQPYTVAAAGHVFEPMGTRFGVSVSLKGAPTLSVYEKSVAVKTAGRIAERTLSAGRQRDFADESVGFISDDPTALVSRTVLVPTAEGGFTDVPRPKGPGLPRGVAESIAALEEQAWERPRDPRPYVKIAVELTTVEERPSAAAAVRQALERDPYLTRCPGEDLLTLARSQGVGTQEGLQDPLGNAEIAERVWRVLEKRGTAPSAYLRAWRDLLSAASVEEAPLAIAVIERDGDPMDPLYVGEALLFEIAQAGEITDNDALVQATGRLSAFIAQREAQSRGGRTSQADIQLATAYAERAEAVFFLAKRGEGLGNAQRAVEDLRRAVEIWPMPRWKVELAAKICEARIPSDGERKEVFRLLREALEQDPSYAIHKRTYDALVQLAMSPRGWDQVLEMAASMADTFHTVAEANAWAAGSLLTLSGESEQAAEYMRRTVRLVGGEENLPDPWRILWAELLWANGERAQARRVASAPTGGAESVHAWEFYDFIGDHRTAVHKLVAMPENEVRQRSYHIATQYGQLGDIVSATEWYRRFIEDSEALARQGGPHDAPTVARARLELAELLAESQLPQAEQLAREVLEDLPETITAWGAGGQVRGELLLKARASWVLGNRGSAVRLLEEFLDKGPLPVDRRREEARLSKWRQELSRLGR